MRILMPLLACTFACLEIVVHILLAPLTLIFGAALLLFTYLYQLKISADSRRALP